MNLWAKPWTFFPGPAQGVYQAPHPLQGLTKMYEMKVSRRFSQIVSQIFAEDINLKINYLRNSADFSAYICEKEKSLFSQPHGDKG